MKKIVTMGEIMLRLSPPDYQRIEQAHSFDLVYGGGEANVAVSLARLGMESTFVSKLPKTPTGTSAEQYLNRFGVNTDAIIYGGDRLGIYFLEKGFSIRPSKVYYDRKYSAFSLSKFNEYNFDEIFEDADWFHISGITPALNEELFSITKKALSKAKEKGLTTSCDLNYRRSLWTFEDARKKMSELMEFVDVCIGIEPLQLLDEHGKEIKDKLLKNPTIEDYKEVIHLIQKQYNIKYLAMTFRESISANRNRLHSVMSDGDAFYESSKDEVEIVDRVGTGDAFAAGLIYSLINNYEYQHCIEFASACFTLKHTIEGDVNIFTAFEIEEFINHKNSFLIQR